MLPADQSLGGMEGMDMDASGMIGEAMESQQDNRTVSYISDEYDQGADDEYL